MARKPRTVKTPKTETQTVTAAEVQNLAEVLKPEAEHPDLKLECQKIVTEEQAEMAEFFLNGDPQKNVTGHPFDPKKGPADAKNLVFGLMDQTNREFVRAGCEKVSTQTYEFGELLNRVANRFYLLQEKEISPWLVCQLMNKEFVPGMWPDGFQTLCTMFQTIDEKTKKILRGALERSMYGKILIGRAADSFEEVWKARMEAYLTEKAISYLDGVDSGKGLVKVREDLRAYLKPFCAPAEGESVKINKWDRETQKEKLVTYTRIGGVLYLPEGEASRYIDPIRESVVLTTTHYAAQSWARHEYGLKAVDLLKNAQGQPVALSVFKDRRFTDKTTGQAVEKKHACIFGARDHSTGKPSGKTIQTDVTVEVKTEQVEQRASSVGVALMMQLAQKATGKRAERKVIIIRCPRENKEFSMDPDFLAKNPRYLEAFAEPTYIEHPVILAIEKRESEERLAEARRREEQRRQQEQEEAAQRERRPVTAEALNALGALGSDFVSAPACIDGDTLVDETDETSPVMDAFAEIIDQFGEIPEETESEEK